MSMKKHKGADLTIRLDEADRRAIDAAAKADHLPASTWLRQAALRLIDDRRAAKARRKKLATLAAGMRRLPRFNRGDAE